MTQTKNPIVALRKDCAGSVVVEFAILGPVLLTMLFGVLQKCVIIFQCLWRMVPCLLLLSWLINPNLIYGFYLSLLL